MVAALARDRLERSFSRIRVGHVQLAAGGIDRVFLDRTRIIARFGGRHNGAVVRPVDRDRDILRDHAAVAVIDGDGESFGDRLTGLQALDVLVAVVQIEGPVARTVDRERTIRALAVIADRPSMRVSGVDVGDVELACGDQAAVFGDRAVGLAGQHGNVVGADDGDHDLAGRAVSRRDGDGFRQGLAGAQALDGRVVVGQVVGPIAIGVDRERAVGGGRVGLDLEHGLAGVGVRDFQLAAYRQLVVFDDFALVAARYARGDDRDVVGAVDGDRDGLRRHAALAVIDRDGERLGQRLARGQRLHGGVGVGQVVGPGAVGGNGQRAILAGAIVVDRPGVRVGRVDVGDIQLAGGDERGVFGYRASGLAAEGRDVIGALDGDGDRAGRAVRRGDGERLGQGFADGQRLHAGIVVVQVVDPRAAGVDRERAVLAGLAGLHDEAGFAVVHVRDV
ncbi:hypothetical protein LMG1861_05068 [Achromobacter piechaudii]|uniref:Uncharacterized protein n=1 Tax=Achromobacter piechaudii TaxID=72556 RepID=A0A6S7EK07_9BURK|nr:hypothetical protein LMG1861_05068 [Achromobacter piechaudii]